MTWQDKNPYELLEVEQSASIEEIELAKKLQLTAWHPDKFHAGEFKQIASERTKKILGFFKILSDEELRESLDNALNADQELEYTPPFEDNKMNNPENWKALSSFMKNNGLNSPKGRAFAYSVGDKYLDKRKSLSPTQHSWALQIWEEAILNGFDQ